MSGHRHVAVAEEGNDRVSVFSVDGDFIRHVGVDQLNQPMGLACSDSDELVVADYGSKRVALFSGSGEVVKTMGCGSFTGVLVHGCSIFAVDIACKKCVVFK
jgi:DNA-binding beta-propeller fold protein YncE